MSKHFKSYKKSYIEHTFYDNRYSFANKINNLHEDCKNGTPIVATQKRVKNNNSLMPIVTIKVFVRCNCPHSTLISLKEHEILKEHEVIHAFRDSHP
jgi:hypothetical protein